MLRLRQILQLLDSHASQSKICGVVRCSKRTVSSYKQVAAESGKSYQELLAMSDSELESIFMPNKSKPCDEGRLAQLELLMPEIIKRLGRKHANVQYVFEEFYQKECPDGYGYTQFNKHVTAFREKNDFSYHNTYEPGEEWQIDFAGDPLYIVDRVTKKPQKLVVLVCVMPYSNLPFMMALPNATTEWFYYGLNKGLEFMGALPHIAKSDNMKQWVKKSERYSPTFTESNLEWCTYYGIQPTACRVRKPRDKGPVEGAVNLLYKYVYARIESETYYTLEALNSRIMELLTDYCDLPYKGSSRMEIFEKYEKPQMLPLPDTMYRLRMRKTVKLGSSYHVCVGSERHMYSVPFKYVHQMVKVLWDIQDVDVYSGTELICHHKRCQVPFGYSTEKAHMPDNHTAYEHQKGQNAASLIERGACIGNAVRWAIEEILMCPDFPQQAYVRCNGLLSLAKKYGRIRLERACELMRSEGTTVSCKMASDILKNSRDINTGNTGIISKTPYNKDVRGAEAYKAMLAGKETDHE